MQKSYYSTGHPIATRQQAKEMRKLIVDAINKRNQQWEPIPSNKLIVVGGAAMQMYGIKKTADIDVVVAPELMQQVLDETWCSWHKRDTDRLGVMLTAVGKGEGQLIKPSEYGSTYGGITYMMAPNDHLYQATFEELCTEASVIDGVLVSPPERILAWKWGVNRPKDRADIAILEQYLANC